MEAAEAKGEDRAQAAVIDIIDAIDTSSWYILFDLPLV
jgi:hypothetical protein